MAKADFSGYLDKKVEDIERPKSPPVGHYVATITGYKMVERNYGEGKEKTPVLELALKINSPYDDAVEAGDSEDQDANKYIGRTVTKDYTLNEEGGQFAIRQVGEVSCGADTKGMSLGDMLEAIKGEEVKIMIDRRMGKGNTEGAEFPDVKKVLPVD